MAPSRTGAAERRLAAAPSGRARLLGPAGPVGAAVCLAAYFLSAPLASAWPWRLTPHRSVVKIYVTNQSYDYGLPWQMRNPHGGTGTGFIIDRRRILTNAHIVSDTRFLEVQREGNPNRYTAEVAFIGHDCDLAVLTVADPEFFRGTRPLRLGTVLPSLNDEVTVLGYPMGGTRISITQGVISRVDYSRYSHSGIDAHLVLQVDAAINPGNSGGPVLYRGSVVGMAFQVLTQGQNIGYAIPIPVLSHFLADIEDGRYHGYPELGVVHLDMRNPAMRRDLGLTPDRSGVVVSYVDPFGSALHVLEPGDVLLGIDDHAIANDGSILLDGNPVEYMELLERKQWGESVAFDVWRGGAVARLTVPLTNPPDPFNFRNLYDRRPEYFILGGLVFSPLTSEYLRRLGSQLGQPGTQHLLYYSQYAKIDGLHEGRREFVVLVNRLAHPANTYADTFLNGILAEINGRPIRSLADVREAANTPVRGFHVIRFEGSPNELVLSAEDAERATASILAQYGVPGHEYIEEAR